MLPTLPLLLPAATSAQAEPQQEGLQDTGEDGGLRNIEAECPMVSSDVAVPSLSHQAPKSHRNMGQGVCDPEEALWQEQGRNSK